MRICPIYSYNKVKPVYSFQKAETKPNIKSNNNSVSFCANLDDFSYNADIYDSFPGRYKIKKRDIDDILNYRINNIVSGKVKKYTPSGRFDTGNKNLYKFGSCIIDDLSTISYEESLTNGEIVTALKKALDNKPNQIEKYGWKKDQYTRTCEIKREFAEELIKRMSELNPNDLPFEEDDDFMEDLADDIAHDIYEKHSKDFEEYTKSIKDKLSYSEYSDVEHFDMEEEFKKLTPEQQEEIIKEYGDNFDDISKNFLADRGSTDVIPKNKYGNFETAIFQTLPRFSSQDRSESHKKGEFELEPVYRWLMIDDMPDFLKDFKVGGEYSYPQSQSCSKNPEQAERRYSDYEDNMNVKLRIHPKSELTKSYNFGDVECNIKGRNNYDDYYSVKRPGEVIYPPNTKFRVLGIYKDYIFTQANKRSSYNPNDNYKVIIDLQEI